jgi:hypothetical protein
VTILTFLETNDCEYIDPGCEERKVYAAKALSIKKIAPRGPTQGRICLSVFLPQHQEKIQLFMKGNGKANTKYKFLYRHQNAGPSYNLIISNKTF